MLVRVAKVLAAGSVPLLLGVKCRSSAVEEQRSNAPVNAGPAEQIPKAKVAVIGAGIGGCTAAYFLRELGARNLDVYVFSATKIGAGRTGLIELDGHFYEGGASLFHSTNKYLTNFAREFDLRTVSRPTTSVCVFNGSGPLLQLGSCSICNKIKLLWQYGISAIRLKLFVRSNVKKFARIYELQSEKQAFATVPEMLQAMGGSEMYELTQHSAQDYCVRKLGWSQRVVDELVTPALRYSYGQDASASAFAMLNTLKVAEGGRTWSVFGGNHLVSQRAFEASGAKVRIAKVQSVARVEDGESLSYEVRFTEQGSGKLSFEKFDVVIIAHPLSVSRMKFENFPSTAATTSTSRSFHHTVVSFMKGEINPAFFGLTAGKSLPFNILTTNDVEKSNLHVYAVGLHIPSDVPEDRLKEYLHPTKQSLMQVWKVFSSKHLSEIEKDKMFLRREAKDVVLDWKACPEYVPSEAIPPFVLDDGVFYINGIEIAVSGMEMSAIGAKNVALLTRDYVLRKQSVES